jgi:hypothetical protein
MPTGRASGTPLIPPTVSCNGSPSFQVGKRHETVTATVTDTVSGPLQPIVSVPANTSRLGVRSALLVAENNAGIPQAVYCSYHVTPLPLKPLPVLRWGFTTVGKETSVQRLVVSGVPAGGEVNLTCRGSGCPFSSAADLTSARCGSAPCQATSKERRRRRIVNLAALLAGSRFSPGVHLTVSVTKTNTVGGVWEFTIRSGKGPSHRSGCLSPGSTILDKGCTLG